MAGLRVGMKDPQAKVMETSLAASTRLIPGGGYLVRRDDLKLTYVRASVLLGPPLPRFRSTELPDLYAELCKRHALEQCQIHGEEGAEFSTEDKSNVDLSRERLRISEQVHRGFDIVKKDFADIAAVVQDKLPVQVFLEPGIDFRVLCPCQATRTH